MSSFKTSAALLGALASTALAHGTVSGFVADGVYNQGFLLEYYYELVNTGSMPDVAGWYAENLDNGFVSPDMYETSDINCHINSEPGALTSTVAAGGTVEFQWTTWPHGIGPVLTYVANCNGDCSSVDKTSLLWVKIDEAGIDIDTQVWAAQDLIDNNSSWTTTVPSTLAAGNYVFRHEIIALHGAGSENGAQNYPQCMNIEITGDGTDNPEGTLGTELYSADDPGILFNPYTTITSYTIPGPALYGSSDSGSDSTTTTAAATTSSAAESTSAASTSTTSPVADVGSSTSSAAASSSDSTTSSSTSAASTSEAAATTSSSTSVAPTTTAQSTTLQTVTRSSTTTSSAATPTSDGGSSGAQALYQQCGGNNWTGATTCVDGAVCKEWNEWYYQCVSSDSA